MKLKKHGVTVYCEHCMCAAADDHGGFDVTVPVNDSESDKTGSARLHCTVSPEGHTVELTGWQDADSQALQLSANLQRRLDSALAFVAEHRVCGNRSICPSAVVRVVEGNS